ncbi:MAG: 3-deoxy-7-phosphoheptulonate synthase [Verrucomicrobia bacterium 61-8]|nr:3-deoxy-7-phosphoheptulonate synthase [Verrucomicrobiota bacterium]OJV11767.1 MAG: 3-deoxy-7-phosphoheptulonate synthase [Verrucomicrobia bacterium 61-8]
MTEIAIEPRQQAEEALPLENIRVRGVTRLITPTQIKEQLPMSSAQLETVLRGREQVRSILRGEDDRLLVVVGPCSIHDPKAALEYAEKLAALSREVADKYFVVMRVYFEKPRTTVGWKGLINDPLMDDSCDMAHGIALARQILLDIAALGLPAGTEFLDPIIPQYIGDLITWSAIGARTTESQTHREMASGLSMPVGFKNGTDGSVQVAIDAMKSSMTPHSFLGIDQDGSTSIVKTSGNPDSHVVLRGGRIGANYGPEHVSIACETLRKNELSPIVMVDCSHANSGKDPKKQPTVWKSILEQRASGRREIIGAMIESNLKLGAQPLGTDPAQLEYGVSITDACMSWEMTEEILRS